MRALHNLVSTLVELGDLERGFALMSSSREAAQRHGHVVAMAWADTQQMDELYWTGAWSELLPRVEEMIEMTRSAAPVLMVIDAYIFRARLRLARGNVEGALEDSARLLEDALIVELDARPETGDDERRRYYQITTLGRAVARAEAQRLHALLRAAEDRALFDPTPSPKRGQA